ncbi:hypothetical protein NQ318_021565 [Aromia moschata]|uniref:Uncharacterized protein n=1 Tax=Aromia moschata TaxID=1265417 RepID=A0AAV8YIM7_9CUCU|nr:hypothetical protein NQ318_021565 [Aromia moschata]
MSDMPKGKKRPHADEVNKFIKDILDLYYNGAVITCKSAVTKRLSPVFEDTEHGGGVQYPLRPPTNPSTSQNSPPKKVFFFILAAKCLSPPFSRMLGTVVVLKIISDPHQPLHRSKLTPEREVDSLIASTQKVFLKSPKRLHAFHSRCPNIPEPPQPILTRCGTWLEATFYYAKYFEQIKTVILEFNPNEAAAIKKSPSTKFQDIFVETI